MNNIESYHNGEVSLAWVDTKILKEFGVNECDTGNIVNIPRSVDGTEIAAFIKKTDEKVKISLRSNGKYNVGEIAVKLGGGGHEMAAGAAVGDISVDEAKEKLLKAIGEVING
jgi:phosphoesterase RecJ-like protein